MHSHINLHRASFLFCLVFFALPFACGCSYLYRGARHEVIGGNPSNPFPDIETIAVAPFATDEAFQDIPPDRSLSYAEIFASELAQFQGFEVVRAYRQAFLPEPARDDAAAVKITSVESEQFVADLDVDAVVIGSVTDYDPYVPRIGVAIQLIYTRRMREFRNEMPRSTDLELLAQTGRPFIVRQPETGRVTMIRIERIFDSRQDAVKNALKKYAATRSGNESPAGFDQFLREHNYFQFVANQMIRDLIKTVREEERAFFAAEAQRRRENTVGE